jgi:hypothetical protein
MEERRGASRAMFETVGGDVEEGRRASIVADLLRFYPSRPRRRLEEPPRVAKTENASDRARWPQQHHRMGRENWPLDEAQATVRCWESNEPLGSRAWTTAVDRRDRMPWAVKHPQDDRTPDMRLNRDKTRAGWRCRQDGRSLSRATCQSTDGARIAVEPRSRG